VLVDKPDPIPRRSRRAWIEAAAGNPAEMKIPSPKQVRDTWRGVRDIRRGGGPKHVRLERVGHPEGFFIPTSEVVMNVKTRSGDSVHLDVNLPVPWPYAWGYRVARKLGLPLASTLDPEDVSFGLGVPSWAWPGGRRRG
jgi:hypothetical protein